MRSSEKVSLIPHSALRIPVSRIPHSALRIPKSHRLSALRIPNSEISLRSYERGMRITDIRLTRKSGGKSGGFEAA